MSSTSLVLSRPHQDAGLWAHDNRPEDRARRVCGLGGGRVGCRGVGPIGLRPIWGRRALMGHLNAGVQRVRLRVRWGLVVALGGLIALAATVLPAAAAGARTHAMRPGATVSRERSSRRPPPPRLPRNFRGRGRWIVRDLGITVPFTWRGRNGNSQMVAGGPRYRIWFTNLIYHDTLYTLTYRWPGVSQHPCSQIPGRFSLRLLNQS